MAEEVALILAGDFLNGADDDIIREHDTPIVLQIAKETHSQGREEDEKVKCLLDKKGEDECQGEDQLIPELGRDLSIDCLVRCSRADYSLVSFLNKSFRSLLKGGYLYEQRKRLGITECWIYLSCMIPDWEAFDPNRRRWISLPKLDADYCFTHSDKESQAVGTELLVFGKDIFCQIIYKYDLLTNSWSSGMMLKHQRCLFASASLGEIAIFAGGSDIFTGKIVGFVEMYNSEKGTWRELPGLSIPRKLSAGVFMDEKFYVIGGMGEDLNGNTNNDLITTAEVYDLKTNTRSQIPNICPPKIVGPSDASASAPPLLAVVNNELYAAYHEQLELWKYNKEANTWRKIGELPFHASSIYGWGIAFRGCGNRLVVIGGPMSWGLGFVEITAWEPTDGDFPTWTLLGRKHCGSFVYNCAVMGC